jgi:hypothetical protein
LISDTRIDTYRDSPLSHERHLTLVLPLEDIDLLVRTFVRLASRETHIRVIMYRVYAIGQHFLKFGEVHGISVAIEEENVISVDLPDRSLDIFVPDLEASVLWICRLIHGIVPSNLGPLSVLDKQEQETLKRTQEFLAYRFAISTHILVALSCRSLFSQKSALCRPESECHP